MFAVRYAFGVVRSSFGYLVWNPFASASEHPHDLEHIQNDHNAEVIACPCEVCQKPGSPAGHEKHVTIVVPKPSEKPAESTRSRAASSGQLTLPRNFFPGKYGKTHYILRGREDAPLVVFSHGVSLFSFVWNKLADLLIERGYRVLLYDFYGHGYSSSPRGQKYSLDLFVDQLHELLTGLNLLKGDMSITLIGHSMGGLVSSEFAARNKEHIKKIVLLNVAGFNTAKAAPENKLLAALHFGVSLIKKTTVLDSAVHLLEMSLKMVARICKVQYQHLVAVASSMDEHQIIRGIEKELEISLESSVAAAKHTVSRLGRFSASVISPKTKRFLKSLDFLFKTWLFQLRIDTESKAQVGLNILRDLSLIDGDHSITFKKISNHPDVQHLLDPAVDRKLPVLVIWGENDGVTPVHIIEELKSCVPDAEVEILPETDHSAFLQQPQRVFEKIVNFLQSK